MMSIAVIPREAVLFGQEVSVIETVFGLNLLLPFHIFFVKHKQSSQLLTTAVYRQE
jgi:hypothetical protein